MITVVGSINLDLVARVERLPTPGETVSGVEYTEVAGGKGANQALAVRRAGASTMMVGAIGHDANAEAATALLKAASVDLTLVEAVDAPTGVALILVDAKTGENQIAVVPGANDHVSIGRLPDETKGLLLQMEIPHAVNEAFLADAEAQGIPVFFNPAPFCANAVDLALKATVIIVNETEFDLLADAMAISPPNHAEDIGEERTRIARGRSFVQKTGKTI
ncbi:MAG: PfkB family carbohydrate kinase, partial [Pseudomonadota bacterium]